MAGRGQDLVMVRNPHFHNLGAGRRPHLRDELAGAAAGLSQRCQNHPPSRIQLGKRSLDPTPLGAGDGMPQNQIFRYEV